MARWLPTAALAAAILLGCEKVPPPLQPDVRGAELPQLGRVPGSWLTSYVENEQRAELRYGVRLSRRGLIYGVQQQLKNGAFAIRSFTPATDREPVSRWSAFQPELGVSLEIAAESKGHGEEGWITVTAQRPAPAGRFYRPLPSDAPAPEVKPFAADCPGADPAPLPRPRGATRARYTEGPGTASIVYQTRQSADDVAAYVLATAQKLGLSLQSWTMRVDAGADRDRFVLFSPSEQLTLTVERELKGGAHRITYEIAGHKKPLADLGSERVGAEVQALHPDVEGVDPEGLVRPPVSWRIQTAAREAHYRSAASIAAHAAHYRDLARALGMAEREWRFSAEGTRSRYDLTFFRAADSCEVHAALLREGTITEIQLEWIGTPGKPPPNAVPPLPPPPPSLPEPNPLVPPSKH